MIAFLQEVPNGVQSWSEDIPGLVQTSLNLGILKLDESLKMTFALRSSSNLEKKELAEKLEPIAASYNAECIHRGMYPAWEYRKDSPLRDTMVDVYEKMFGQKPEVVAIHAGLECGLLGEKIPGLDCVSLGPNIEEVHSVRERLNISSTERLYRIVCNFLENWK